MRTCSQCYHYITPGQCMKHRRVVSSLRNADDLPCFTDYEIPTTMEENKTPTTKVCKECGRELPLEQFAKNPHGYTSLCKECMKAKQSKGVKAHRDGLKELKDQMERSSMHKPEYQPEGKKAPAFDITTASDADLVAELRRRGYAGTLTKTHTLEV